jgi:hypothetical protein
MTVERQGVSGTWDDSEGEGTLVKLTTYPVRRCRMLAASGRQAGHEVVSEPTPLLTEVVAEQTFR